MSAWKVLVIGVLACASLALGMATIALPLAQDGNQKWVWLGGLLAATLVAGGLLMMFMRYAGHALDESPRAARR